MSDISRVAIRAKYDLIVRETKSSHEAINEYDVGEIRIKLYSANSIIKAGVKLRSSI